jgi:hypothetical protein
MYKFATKNGYKQRVLITTKQWHIYKIHKMLEGDPMWYYNLIIVKSVFVVGKDVQIIFACQLVMII